MKKWVISFVYYVWGQPITKSTWNNYYKEFQKTCILEWFVWYPTFIYTLHYYQWFMHQFYSCSIFNHMLGIFSFSNNRLLNKVNLGLLVFVLLVDCGRVWSFHTSMTEKKWCNHSLGRKSEEYLNLECLLGKHVACFHLFG